MTAGHAARVARSEIQTAGAESAASNRSSGSVWSIDAATRVLGNSWWPIQTCGAINYPRPRFRQYLGHQCQQLSGLRIRAPRFSTFQLALLSRHQLFFRTRQEAQKGGITTRRSARRGEPLRRNRIFVPARSSPLGHQCFVGPRSPPSTCALAPHAPRARRATTSRRARRRSSAGRPSVPLSADARAAKPLTTVRRSPGSQTPARPHRPC